MRRDHLEFLRKWRDDPIRVPLMIRGARQVGKSWLVSQFGQDFDHFMSINFEKDKRVHALFPEHIEIRKNSRKSPRLHQYFLHSWKNTFVFG